MSTKLWGVLAQYENPHTVTKACEAVRDAGYSEWDACAPFPVHGLDRAMGIKPSKLPWIVLTVGILGFCTSFSANFSSTNEVEARDAARVAIENVIESLREAVFEDLS